MKSRGIREGKKSEQNIWNEEEGEQRERENVWEAVKKRQVSKESLKGVRGEGERNWKEKKTDCDRVEERLRE